MSTEAEQTAGQDWQEDVFRVLKAHDVKHVVFVPDAGHSAAIRLAYADPAIKAVVLTLVWSGGVSLVLFWGIDKVFGLRPSTDDERQGLDQTSHGENAYNT